MEGKMRQPNLLKVVKMIVILQIQLQIPMMNLRLLEELRMIII